MMPKYHHPFIVRKFLESFEKQCGQKGIKALKKIIPDNQIIIHPIPFETKKIINDNGALIILNHPHYAEIIATFHALPDREDIFIIITDSFFELLPNLRQYMIPVHIQHHTTFVGIKKYFNIGRLFYYPVIKTKEEAHTFNKNSITLAAKLINQGHLVIICPQGLYKKKPVWFTGIGHLVSQLNPKTPLINLFIDNTSFFDFFRLIPIIKLLFPKFNIYFDKPNYTTTKDPKIITKELENKFNQWASKIHPNQS